MSTPLMSKVYLKSRYDKERRPQPMTSKGLWISMKPWSMRKKAPLNSFEKYFEGCMPIEKSWLMALKPCFYGPMKPVVSGTQTTIREHCDGLSKTPYAVVSFRSRIICDW